MTDQPSAPDHLGHRERLRERFLREPGAIPDYELLEMLLAIARPRVDTKPAAKALMRHFNDSLAEVLSADPEALAKVDDVGPVTVVVLKCVQEAAQRLLRPKTISTDVISSWGALIDYLTVKAAYGAVEQFRVIYLNRKNQLIADEAQQRGTVDHTPVYPREVARRALELNASAVVVCHNHPSGDPKPSQPDVEMTRKIKDALAAVGITLHDHVIVSRGGPVSFRTLGLL
ncbi:MAG: DNA repair protein RadC [Rhodospirillaceae bacterium]|nr:DNA repair protein RadC [Rhodospirillaceae bacterium]